METGMTGGMLIAVHEARDACKGESDIIKRLEKAMKAVKDHWMETDEQNQFKSALAAAMLESDEPDKDRIQRSVASLRKVNAMMNALTAGVPVDVEAMAAEPIDADLLPLNKMWHALAA